MVMKRVILSTLMISLVLGSSWAYAQYEDRPYVEAFVGANFAVPFGYVKNDLKPDSLNATSGIGFDAGAGYYMTTKIVTGLYYTNRNLGTNDIALHHRAYEVGAYGKFFFSDMTAVSKSPYVRLSLGMNFSKMVTKVQGETGPVFRELSYDPTVGAGLAIGFQVKTNEFGALFIEASYNYEMSSNVVGEYKGAEYEWGGNNQYAVVKAGVVVNIGRKE